MNERRDEIEIDPGRLMRYRLRHWVVLLISTLVLALAAFFYTKFMIAPRHSVWQVRKVQEV